MAKWQSDPFSRKRRWLVFLLGCIGLALVVVVGGMIVAANRDTLPNARDLEKVSLKLPKSPAGSPALAKLLANDFGAYQTFARAFRKHIYYSRKKTAELQALGRRFGIESFSKPGQWLPDPSTIRRRLQRLAPPIDQTRNALMAPGCLDGACQHKDKNSTNEFSLLVIVNVLVIRAVSEIQLGEINPSGWNLIALFDRLRDLTTCPGVGIFHMVIEAALRAVAEAFRYVLAVPKSSPRLQQAIWERLLVFEKLPSPAAKTILCEQYLFHDMLEQLIKDSKMDRSYWPWFVKQHTLKRTATR